MSARDREFDAREALLEKSADDLDSHLASKNGSMWYSTRRALEKHLQHLSLNNKLHGKAAVGSGGVESRDPNAPLSLLRRFSYAFVPQFFRTRFFNDPAREAKINPTSWMNGIRGLAAVAVFNQHYLNAFTWTVFNGYGTTPADQYLHQLPGITLLYDGMCALMIFFTVSGYVCGAKPLQAMTEGNGTALFSSLPASVFRRWFRLYLPVFCWTMVISFLAYAGAYEPARFLVDDIGNMDVFPGPAHGKAPIRFSTLARQLNYWWDTMSGIMNFWIEFPKYPPLDRHLWTIVQEFRYSMHLYIALVGIACCKTWARIFLLLLLGYIYIAMFNHWIPVAFFYGALLSQFDILRTRQQKKDAEQRERLYKSEGDAERDRGPSVPSADPTSDSTLPISSSPSPPTLPGLLAEQTRGITTFYNTRLSSFMRTLLYFLAVYLMSFPHRGLQQTAVLYEYAVVPLLPSFYGKGIAPYFYKQIGVLLLMYLLSSIPMAQRAKSIWHRALTSHFAQYCGSIMFALYLAHGTTQHMFGYALPHWFWRRWNPETAAYVYKVPDDMRTFMSGLFISWAITLFITLCIADVWTREVESRCVKFTKWLEGFMFIKPGGK